MRYQRNEHRHAARRNHARRDEPNGRRSVGMNVAERDSFFCRGFGAVVSLFVVVTLVIVPVRGQDATTDGGGSASSSGGAGGTSEGETHAGTGGGAAPSGGRPGRPVGGFAPGGSTPGRPRGGATGGPLANGLATDDWQNWWKLNAAWYLDLERRYRERSRQDEDDPDVFFGDAGLRDARPVVGGEKRARATVLPVLAKLIDHDHHAVRSEVAIALGKVGSKTEIASLLRLSKDRHGAVRRAAILGLGLLGETAAVPYLRAYLRDPATRRAERAYAAFALGVIGGDDVVEPLRDLYHSSRSSREERAVALYSLGFTGDSRATTLLEAVIDDRDADNLMRAAAVQGIGNLRDDAMARRLLRAAVDRDTGVRRSAVLSLGQLSFDNPYRDELTKFERRLALRGEGAFSPRAAEEVVRLTARLRLRAITEDQRLRVLRSRLHEELVLRLHLDGDVMVRNFAAVALGQIGGPEACATLYKAWSDTKLSSTRAFAMLGLGVAKARAIGPLVVKEMSRRRRDHKSLGAVLPALGLMEPLPEAHPLLLAHLRTRSDGAVTSYAAIGLGLLGADKAVAPLRSELDSKSRPELKPAFGLALGLLGDHHAVKSLSARLRGKAPLFAKVQSALALGAIHDERALDGLAAAALKRREKDFAVAASVRALGQLAERGDRPLLAPFIRHFDYLLPIATLREIARES